MKLLRWLLVFFGAAAALGAGFLAYLLTGTSLSVGCNETELKRWESPGGRYIATLFERSCGATTDAISHLNLRDARADFRAHSNGIIDEGEIYSLKGRHSIQAEWRSDTDLVVRSVAPREADRGIKEERWSDVVIVYER